MEALIERYGKVANTFRWNIDEAPEAGDADTADIFAPGSRGLEKHFGSSRRTFGVRLRRQAISHRGRNARAPFRRNTDA
jgi:hypothetical protein